jgi:hypothetical protein
MKTSCWRTPLTPEEIWRSLEHKGASGHFQRIDDEHPGDFYAGLDNDRRRGLVLLSDTALNGLPALENIRVDAERQTDRRWRTYFWLEVPELRGLFSALADDIVTSSRALKPAEIPRFTVARIARWHRLLESDDPDTLSLAELRGLIGEVAVLRAYCDLYGPVRAVDAWQGPLGTSQDFVLATMRTEVKTVQPAANRVRISSVDQLDALPGSDLRLAVVALAQVSVDAPDGFTMPEYIEELRAVFAYYPGTWDDFLVRLAAAGYKERPEYASMRFRLDGTRYFAVTEQFPRLVRADLKPGVIEANYQIALSAAHPFEREVGE